MTDKRATEALATRFTPDEKGLIGYVANKLHLRGRGNLIYRTVMQFCEPYWDDYRASLAGRGEEREGAKDE